MAKNPFEKILSLVERKKILLSMAITKSPIICKLSNGSLLSLRGRRLTKEGHLEVLVDEKKLGNGKLKIVVIFFYFKKDRYFINTRLLKSNDGSWIIYNGTNFFKLNRRESYRVMIPDDLRISLHVTSAAGLTCNVQARVTEFSSGGARIRWLGIPEIIRGSVIKGQLIWMKGKTVPVVALVKHITADDHYGIEFTNLDSIQNNRLRILSIELQQIVNYLTVKA